GVLERIWSCAERGELVKKELIWIRGNDECNGDFPTVTPAALSTHHLRFRNGILRLFRNRGWTRAAISLPVKPVILLLISGLVGVISPSTGTCCSPDS